MPDWALETLQVCKPEVANDPDVKVIQADNSGKRFYVVLHREAFELRRNLAMPLRINREGLSVDPPVHMTSVITGWEQVPAWEVAPGARVAFSRPFTNDDLGMPNSCDWTVTDATGRLHVPLLYMARGTVRQVVKAGNFNFPHWDLELLIDSVTYMYYTGRHHEFYWHPDQQHPIFKFKFTADQPVSVILGVHDT